MKASFRDFRKKDGSIEDFAECNWKIIFLTEEYKVDLIWSLEHHNTGKTFNYCKITFALLIIPQCLLAVSSDGTQ